PRESGRPHRLHKYKDSRARARPPYRSMPLPPREFTRRSLPPVLPHGLHRIRHYGLFANGSRVANIARARELLAVPVPAQEPDTSQAATDQDRARPCPCCGGRMIIIETFERGSQPKHRPTAPSQTIRIDTS